jgi:DNA-binding NtrC family response regulator
VIEVESEEGKGTTFTILLPAENTHTVIDNQENPENFNNVVFSGNVLVMDDEDMVRETVKDMLTLLGFTVYTAENGEKAIELYKKFTESAKKFAFVVTDLTVKGGMGGKETIKEILKIDQNAKVIVASGYSKDDVISNYKKYGFKGRVIKPFTIEKIKEEIIKVLEN